jgi:hypothetical protein
MAGDTFRDAIRGALDAILLANPSITWPHRDTLNTGVKPDAGSGYFELEFPGGDENQYTFGAPGFNDWQETGQITVRAVVRQNAGKTERDRAEVYIETIRGAFRGRRIPIGARAIRIVRTGAMGGGQDEAGMWVESIGLEYQLFNVG